MKRELYDLTDEPFVMFVNKIGDVLRKEAIEHNLVGGVAVQSYILKMLTQKYNSSVCELIQNSKVRLQDYVRSTDDVDLALRLDGANDAVKIKRINSLLPLLEFEEISPCGESIVQVRTERIGASRPTFRVYVDGRGSGEEVIALNVGRGNKGALHNLNDSWYDVLIADSQHLVIPYTEGYSLKVNVPTLEHLLATKIAGARAKDLMDNKNLTDLSRDVERTLDFDEITQMLLPENREKYMTFLKMHHPERLKSNHIK